MNTQPQSQYLVRALQGLQQPMTPPQVAQMNPAQMAQVARNAQAYQQANPGGSFIGHNLMQAGRNIAAAPGNVASGLGGLAQRLGLYGTPQSPAPAPAPRPIAPIQPSGPMQSPPRVMTGY